MLRLALIIELLSDKAPCSNMGIDVEGYNEDCVTHCEKESASVIMASIESVAGGSLNIICSGSAELLLRQA